MMKRFVSAFLVFALLFLSVPNVSFASVNDEELEGFLIEREITRDQLDEYLARWGQYVNDFDTLEELSYFVYTVKGTDPDGFPFIQYTLDWFEITYDELISLLAENGYTIDDFIFTEDIDDYLLENFEWDWDWEEEEDYCDPSLEPFFKEFEFTCEEYTNLINHLFDVIESNPETVDQLSALADRMIAFDDFESARELTAEEIAELFSIGKELIDLLKLKPEYYLAKPGEQKPISFTDLMNLDKLEGYDLLVVLYNQQNDKLADFFISAEMFNAVFMKKVGGDVEEVARETENKVEEKNQNPTPPSSAEKTAKPSDKKVSKAEASTTSKKVTKTVDGAKMPKTATSYPAYAMIGLMMTLGGVILFRRLKMAS
ncbi:processed acidic surface protein [Alkalicoccobacillus porphyridii]|uniref:Processed acidic surface protein n=1 Tax=Alkalicoccobacillus porphyridii TaxID=2597270 RepID=A0A553ZU19_9BACI|nr:processed acidic surface protein [Alkalicoccobacillus porphyridii]TSB44971.1 processed acidic surface protein [Alkalicoccobacillus porphyridii]